VGLYLMAAIDWAELGDKAWQIGSVAAGLGFVIFVHELGHFLIAKWCGVKCEKFYVGFDVPIKIFGVQLPSKLVHFQWGETEYGVGIIPLGGYVKMLGQDDDPRAAQAELERIRIKKNQDENSSEDSTTTDQAISSEAASEDPSKEEPSEEEFELDPRSFPAKSVPQRMAIISAGVIMNLIFAVLFATYAFRAGVPYTPCEVGAVVPGSPAWVHGVQPQTRIVQVGEREKRKSFLRFRWDLSNGVNMVDDGESLLVVTQDADGEERTYDIVPSTIEAAGMKRRLLGIAPSQTCQLASEKPAYPQTSAAAAAPELEGGDKIKAINGTAVNEGYEVQTILASNWTQPITVTVERSKKGETATSTQDVTVEPNHIRRLGLVMTTGPVVGIRPSSPAAIAGFELGDRIETIAGEPMGDPMSLPTQVLPHHEQEIEIQVRRGEELVALQITPQTPAQYDWTFSENSPMASIALGVAFAIDHEVQSVVSGSPADRAGIKAGDLVATFKALYDEPKDRAERGENKEKPFSIDGVNVTWAGVFQSLQYLPSDLSLKLAVTRDGESLDFTMKPEPTDELNPDRGFRLTMKSETYVAQSWGEAVSLGAGRTWEDAQRVTTFLKKLVTGRIALTNVGGPLTIAVVAGSEASEGLPRLLIFLTFLSANLAVVNFMPIPALDGGHFIFLLWEGISGKPVNERVQIALTLVGVGALLCLMIFVFGLDINRLFF
jgi:regulator of sigma E protease